MSCQACVAWSDLRRVRYAPENTRGGPGGDRLLHASYGMSRPCVPTSQLGVIAIDLLPEGLVRRARWQVADWLSGQRLADQSEVIAVNPLIELLGVHRAGSASDAGDY